jgi:hypothetical protein
VTDTRIVPCPSCGGDKGHAYPVDINPFDGSLIEHWYPCEACEATGEIEIALEPVELGSHGAVPAMTYIYRWDRQGRKGQPCSTTIPQ